MQTNAEYWSQNSSSLPNLDSKICILEVYWLFIHGCVITDVWELGELHSNYGFFDKPTVN